MLSNMGVCGLEINGSCRPSFCVRPIKDALEQRMLGMCTAALSHVCESICSCYTKTRCPCYSNAHGVKKLQPCHVIYKDHFAFTISADILQAQMAKKRKKGKKTEKKYVVDPGGEVTMILKNPNAAFAVWGEVANDTAPGALVRPGNDYVGKRF